MRRRDHAARRLPGTTHLPGRVRGSPRRLSERLLPRVRLLLPTGSGQPVAGVHRPCLDLRGPLREPGRDRRRRPLRRGLSRPLRLRDVFSGAPADTPRRRHRDLLLQRELRLPHESRWRRGLSVARSSGLFARWIARYRVCARPRRAAARGWSRRSPSALRWRGIPRCRSTTDSVEENVDHLGDEECVDAFVVYERFQMNRADEHRAQ